MLDNKAYVSQEAFTEIDNNQKETDVSSPEEIDDYDGLNEDELTDQINWLTMQIRWMLSLISNL